MKNSQSPRAGAGNKRRKPRRWWKLLQWAALIAFCLLAILAVALLWRPAGASRRAPGGDFADVLLQTGLVSASIETPVYGRSTLTIRNEQIADVVAAALKRDDPAVPPPVAALVEENVPAWIQTASGCTIDPGALSLYLACSKGLPFYVTLTGRLVRRDDGGMDFRLTGIAVGAVPLPLASAKKLFNLRDTPIIEPDDAGFHVESVRQKEGRMELGLRRNGQ